MGRMDARKGRVTFITGGMGDLPVLVVVSAPAGSGKTTLAHEIARAIGCPAA
jgi:guanylate kinase